AIAIACLGLATAANARSKAKPTMTIGTTVTPPSLDGFKWGGFHPAGGLVWKGLVVPRPDGSFVPGLAASWRFLKSEGNSLRENKDFEITLRRGVRFADGTPMNARAVKTWFDFVYSENMKVSGSANASTIWGVPVSSVEVTSN